MCAYMLMHFLEDEEVFGFLGEIKTEVVIWRKEAPHWLCIGRETC